MLMVLTSFQTDVITMNTAATPRMAGRFAPTAVWMLVLSPVMAVVSAVEMVSLSLFLLS